MNVYITDTSYSTSELIRLIFEEEHKLSALEQDHIALMAEAERLYQVFKFKDLHEDFDDMHVMHDFNNMASAKLSADQVQDEINSLKLSISAKEFSLNSLSGALLQIAKQGISIVYANLHTCPNGRMVGSEALKNIIWQGRNQSMHFEEGNPHRAVQQCFRNLEADFGPQFSLSRSPSVNLARKVVNLLGWTEYAIYENDMKSILN